MVRVLVGIIVAVCLFAQTRVDYTTQVMNGPILSDAGTATTLASNCTNAFGRTLSITRKWTAVATMTCTAPLVFNGGSIQPASGQTVTLSGVITAPLSKIFDLSAGGTVVLTAPGANAYPNWWGEVANGTGTAGTDQSAVIQAAVNAVAGGTLTFAAAPLAHVIWAAVIVPGSTTIVIPQGATIQKKYGVAPTCSPGCTAIFEAGDGTSAVTDIWFRGSGTIDGNKANVTGISGDGFNEGIYFRGCTTCGVAGLTIENAYTGNIAVDCYGSPATSAGNNVQILNNVITASRRNNIELLCGIGTIISGNQISGATGGSSTAGIDVEPSASGAFVTGTQIVGNEISSNTGDCMDLKPTYDVSPAFLVQNNYCHGNGGAVGVQAENFYVSGPTGYLLASGNRLTDGSTSSFNLAGWLVVTINSPYILNTGISSIGLLISSNNPTVLVAGGTISGGADDVSVDGADGSALTILGTHLVCSVSCFQGSSGAYVTYPLTGKPFLGPAAWSSSCVPYWLGTSPRDGTFGCSGYSTINDNGGTNPDYLISDGTVFVKLQLVTGANGFVGTQSNHPINIGANNASIGATGSLTVYPNGSVEQGPANHTGLGACSSGNRYRQAHVNDSTTQTWGATYTGGGSDTAGVVCDGANWTVFALQ